MVFISVLLAMILGVLAYVARLTIIGEGRSRGSKASQPNASEKKTV